HRSKHAVVTCIPELMLERMTCKRCMVRFDVEFEIIFQSIFLEECVTACHIKIILVGSRLLRFRFDQELAFESDPLRIILRHFKEACQVIKLQLHISVDKTLVSFTSS